MHESLFRDMFFVENKQWKTNRKRGEDRDWNEIDDIIMGIEE